MIDDIRSLRISAGYTLQELADRIGTTPTQISRLELGHRKLTPKWKKRIADGLGVDVQRVGAELTEDDEGIFSKILDEQNIVKEIFEKNLYDQPSSTGSFDKEFLIICFETVCSFKDIAPKADFITSRLIFLCATQMHDVFSSLFGKVGRSVELLTALRHFVQAFLLSVMRESLQPPKDKSGKLLPSDDRMALFRGVLDPFLDPVERKVVEKALGRKLTSEEVAMMTKVDKIKPGD